MLDPNLQRQALLAALSGAGPTAAPPGIGAPPMSAPAPPMPVGPPMGGPPQMPGAMPPGAPMGAPPVDPMMLAMAQKFAPFLPPVLGHHPYPGDVPEPGMSVSPAHPASADGSRGRRS